MHADLRHRTDLHAPERHRRADRQTGNRALKHHRNRYGRREQAESAENQNGNDGKAKAAQHETAHSNRFNGHWRPF